MRLVNIHRVSDTEGVSCSLGKVSIHEIGNSYGSTGQLKTKYFTKQAINIAQ